MPYLRPTDAPISASWQDHRNRNPPSGEPGTDYACAYGTNLVVADAGTVSVIDRSNGGAEGRRVSIDLDDGRRVSYIHLSDIAGNAFIGQRVIRGQTNFIWSGASGYGDDWHYGPHVHVSLFERPGLPYSQTIDFENYVGNDPEEPDMDAEQDARLKNIENMLSVPGQGYGWPQVTSQGVSDVQARLAVPGAGYDWLPAVNNAVGSLWKPVTVSAAASVVALIAILLPILNRRR